MSKFEVTLTDADGNDFEMDEKFETYELALAAALTFKTELQEESYNARAADAEPGEEVEAIHISAILISEVKNDDMEGAAIAAGKHA